MHTFITSGGKSGEQKNKKRRAIFINSVKFYDNEDEIEGEAEQLAEHEH